MLQNGNSNVAIAANGNVTVSVAGTANVLQLSDSLATLNSNLTLVTAPNDYSVIQSTGDLDIYSGDGNAAGSNLSLVAGTGNVGGNVSISGGFGNATDGGIVTISGGTADSVGTGGNVTIQGGTGADGGQVNIVGGIGTSGAAGNINLESDLYTWKFDNTGNTTLPYGYLRIGGDLGGGRTSARSLTTTSTAANQTISSFSISETEVTGVEFLVKGSDSTGGKYSVAKVVAVTNGTTVDYTVFSTVNIGNVTGTGLQVAVSSGNLELQITPSSSNSTVWTTQYTLV